MLQLSTVWFVCFCVYKGKVLTPHIGAIAFRSAHFGQGSSTIPIHLNNVRCTGLEEGLLLCRYDSTGSFCSHSQDASVQCQYPGKTIECIIKHSIVLVMGCISIAFIVQ